ncbi:hypothetical protein AHAS_Ahas05G0144300 [Arachis hypogaea]
MRRRDTQTWSVMIVAYAMHGHGFRAVSMLEETKKEKVQPGEITSVAVLSACSHNGLVEEGYISILDDSYGGDYVVLSNLCARYGKWEDVNFLSKKMVDEGAVKIPGCSSIEVNNIVHVFFSGDGVHSTSTALHHALDKLVKEPKLAGYVAEYLTPLVFHTDMDDEEREIILRYQRKSYLETCSNFIISKMGNVPVGITDPGQWHKGGAGYWH